MLVNYEREDTIATITIERPERRNAVDAATATALVEAFERFDEDSSASVSILRGAGGNFCAGADLKALASGERKPLRPEGHAPMGPTRMELHKPVIAAIEGYAVAGGMELALWCDLRVMASGATLGIFCRRFGVPLVDLGTIRLPRMIGHSRAMDLILTGRPVHAKEALEIGLVNRLAENGQAYDKAKELAKTLAAFPQACLRNDRLSLLRQWDLTTSEATAAEIEFGLNTVESGETLSGATRFGGGEGRNGVFQNQ